MKHALAPVPESAPQLGNLTMDMPMSMVLRDAARALIIGNPDLYLQQTPRIQRSLAGLAFSGLELDDGDYTTADINAEVGGGDNAHTVSFVDIAPETAATGASSNATGQEQGPSFAENLKLIRAGGGFTRRQTPSGVGAANMLANRPDMSPAAIARRQASRQLWQERRDELGDLPKAN